MKNFINNTIKECKEIMKEEWRREFGEKGFIETVKEEIKNDSRIQYSLDKLKGNAKNNIDFINNKILQPSKNESKTIEDQINKLYKSIECDKIAIEESKTDEERELNKKLLKIHEERLAALEKVWFFEE
jgi:hypothetical protein